MQHTIGVQPVLRSVEVLQYRPVLGKQDKELHWRSCFPCALTKLKYLLTLSSSQILFPISRYFKMVMDSLHLGPRAMRCAA